MQSGAAKSKSHITKGKQAKIFAGRVGKGMAAAAVGYPVYQATASYLDFKKEQRDLEKVAFVGFLSKVPKLFPMLKNTLPGVKNFARGATGLGKSNFKSPSYLAGTGGAVGAAAMAPGVKATKLEKATTFK